MIKKYFTLMWRKAIRNKSFTLINIFGLSVGIAVFILIMLWIQKEFSYDKYNANLERIYRIEINDATYMSTAIAQTLKNEFPDIEKSVRFSSQGSALLMENEKSVTIENFILADSALFDIFTFNFISGNPKSALTTPFSIVLTESVAGKLFGSSDPFGKPVRINNQLDFIVTGIIRDVKNSHKPVDAIGSFVTLGKLFSQPDFLNSFRSWNYPTYFLISRGTNINDLNSRMNKFINDLFVRTWGAGNDDTKARLIPLKEIYFHNPHYPPDRHGNLKLVYIFLVVSILTMVIACINFINLTIAKSSTVAREVGVKKVFGSSYQQLFFQFLLESIILCFISSLFAVTIIQLIIPLFNQFTGGNLSLEEYLSAGYISLYFLIVLVIGILAGIYPAIRLSSYSPVIYFRKFGGRGGSKSIFRTGLVIFQFLVSIVLILSVLIIITQINYLRKFNTGFDKNNVIVLNVKGRLDDKREAFRNEIMTIPGIRNIAFSSVVPGQASNFEGFSYNGVLQSLYVFTVDPSFLPLIGVKIAEGRNFSWERPNDRYGVCLLNKEAVKLWGIKDPVGTILKHSYYLTTLPREQVEIIGVIDDFHFLSPKDSINPVLFCYGDWFNRISIRVDPVNINETIKQIETIWKKFVPGFPFTYQYLEDFYGTQYKNEFTLSKTLVFFSFIAILIACLGLLGLSSFIAQEKTKEIGIRKVFGATSGSMMRMLSASFLKWVAIAILIGSPFAVVNMNKWLTNFANHTSITWWLVALAAMILLSISLLTIIFHILKVSRTNPINALRYE